MSYATTVHEEAQDLGEVVSNGLRYRIFFDSMRHRTVCVLVAGQRQVARPTVPIDYQSDAAGT
jgi:hypothetical protein